MSRTLRIVHEVSFDFHAERFDVSAWLRLCPLDSPRQRLLHHQVISSPTPTLQLVGRDAFGNEVAETFWETLRHVTVRAMSAVELVSSGERLVALEPCSFREPTSLTPVGPPFAALGHRIFAGRTIDASSLFDFAKAMRTSIVHDPRYARIRRSATSALLCGEGDACDYAHIAVTVLRSLGYAACYIHGYLLPPAGAGKAQPHAWIAVHTSRGWLEVDPMLGCPPDARHVALSVGRDADDTTPVKSPGLKRGIVRIRRRFDFYPLVRTRIAAAGSRTAAA